MPPARDESKPRRLKLTPKMFQKYGYSIEHGIDCEGCRRKQAGLEARAHTEECRARMDRALDGDEEGRRWKAQAEDRMTGRLAEELEKAVTEDQSIRAEDVPVPEDSVSEDENIEEEQEMEREQLPPTEETPDSAMGDATAGGG